MQIIPSSPIRRFLVLPLVVVALGCAEARAAPAATADQPPPSTEAGPAHVEAVIDAVAADPNLRRRLLEALRTEPLTEAEAAKELALLRLEMDVLKAAVRNRRVVEGGEPVGEPLRLDPGADDVLERWLRRIDREQDLLERQLRRLDQRLSRLERQPARP